ncbi:FRG domain-containing protein [Geodermatophilus sp. URMC 62]|uniref:FRG domain-containing protein n=1 Tax=Geodermatophilus sp. URMC 62 TaxID=3423414 RepID=UPI00406BE1E6
MDSDSPSTPESGQGSASAPLPDIDIIDAFVQGKESFAIKLQRLRGGEPELHQVTRMELDDLWPSLDRNERAFVAYMYLLWFPREHSGCNADMPSVMARIRRLEEEAPGLPTISTVGPWISPTTALDRGEWMKANLDLQLDAGFASRLYYSGFAPLDPGVLNQAQVPNLLSMQPGIHALVDLDYGMLLFAGSAGPEALDLDLREALAYVAAYPHLALNPTDLLRSVGASRGKQALHRLFVPNLAQPPEVTIRTRKELSDLLTILGEWLTANPEFELWFRGQPGQYAIPALPANDAVLTPWRCKARASLVPSLYRGYEGKVSDLAQYADFCAELVHVTHFVTRRLGISDWTPTPTDAPALLGLGRGAVEWESGRSVGGETTTRYYLPYYRALQRSFFLQHYGLPSNILDITVDVDVALFFAQHRVIEGEWQRVHNEEHNAAPAIYVFLLHTGLDPFVPSKSLAEHYGLLRPLRQKCGMLGGASLMHRNKYARYVSLVVKLEQGIDSCYSPDYLFPPREEDHFLDQLLNYCDDEGIVTLSPL